MEFATLAPLILLAYMLFVFRILNKAKTDPSLKARLNNHWVWPVGILVLIVVKILSTPGAAENLIQNPKYLIHVVAIIAGYFLIHQIFSRVFFKSSAIRSGMLMGILYWVLLIVAVVVFGYFQR